MDSKDRSIVAQVAAKIASELTTHALQGGENAEEVGNVFVRVFGVVLDGVFDGISEVEAKYGKPVVARPAAAVADIGAALGGTVEDESSDTWTVRVAGKQHGDLPPWLFAAASKNGTVKVFDNRDKLASSPKRPWFVDADNRDNAYWPPKGR